MILAKGTNRPDIALANAPEKTSYRVERVDGPESESHRLSEMGLVPGTEVSVVSQSRNGMTVVRVGGCRLALARGMADYVRVK